MINKKTLKALKYYNNLRSDEIIKRIEDGDLKNLNKLMTGIKKYKEMR